MNKKLTKKQFLPILSSLVVCSFYANSVYALAMTQTYNVDFASSVENFWGPGGGTTDFGIDQFLLGNSTFGVHMQAGASTGTVRSNYNGSISVEYDNEISIADGGANLSLQYFGDINGGHFETLLGAFVNVTAYFPVIGGVTITSQGYSLATNRTYTPSPADSISDSDSFTPASASIGPDIGIGSAQAGVDFDITQNATHEIDALNGVIRAIHRDSGTTRERIFSLASIDNFFLNLDLLGAWDIDLIGLSLDNLFSTDFDLDVVAFVQYTLGIDCGDPGTDSDNSGLCADDGRLSLTLAGLDLFSNTPFALAMRLQNTLASFEINVVDVVDRSVPVPATLALLSLGMVGIGLSYTRRRGRIAS